MRCGGIFSDDIASNLLLSWTIKTWTVGEHLAKFSPWSVSQFLCKVRCIFGFKELYSNCYIQSFTNKLITSIKVFDFSAMMAFVW